MIVGSLCSGYSGLEQGLKMVFPQARLAWVADNDKAASILLAARYPGVPNLGDITQVDWSKVEKVDVLAAGIPCQPHSLAGKGKGADDDRDLVEAFIGAVRALRPGVVILENVPGFKRWGLPRVLGALAEMGFHARWHSVRAAEAGASHRRERVFVLAYSADDGQQWSRLARLRGLGLANGSEAASDANNAQRRGEQGQQPWRPSAPWGGLQAAPDSDGVGRFAWGGNRQRPPERPGPESGSAEAAPNAYGGPRPGRTDEPIRGSQERETPERHSEIDWGEYEAAIRRQEHVFGRLAPDPTEIGQKGNVRLAARFPEWMMGISDGWVTDFGFSRKDTFRLIGNGVVPRQAALAIKGLIDEESDSDDDGRASPRLHRAAA